jgi:putative NIF3 family GTP cyclohydrolase 1 type 2
MEATKLYAKLENNFIRPGLSDDWIKHMDKVQDYISENFKKRSMGLVCDYANEIDKVYTAVFPTDDVLKKIIDGKETNIMLFVHHPSIWDMSKKEIWQQMNTKLLDKFKKNRISIYNLHVPLDNYGKYSTSTSLAKALKIKPVKKFAPYHNGYAGIIGKTGCKTIQELSAKFKEAVHHKTSMYRYGTDEIHNKKVAVVAGGGNSIEILQEISDNNINVLVTGLTKINDYSKPAHDFAMKNKINLLGGTHYSTEKFACIEMCKYFKRLGLESEFIPGKPGMEDL